MPFVECEVWRCFESRIWRLIFTFCFSSIHYHEMWIVFNRADTAVYTYGTWPDYFNVKYRHVADSSMSIITFFGAFDECLECYFSEHTRLDFGIFIINGLNGWPQKKQHTKWEIMIVSRLRMLKIARWHIKRKISFWNVQPSHLRTHIWFNRRREIVRY